MDDTQEYFYQQSFDKLRGLVKSLIDNKNIAEQDPSLQTAQILKFIKEIKLILESRIQNTLSDDMEENENSLSIQRNFKDLWVLLQFLIEGQEK